MDSFKTWFKSKWCDRFPSDTILNFPKSLEKAIQDAGHPNFYNGAFVLIGGGDRDVGTVIVRSIVRDANAMGILFDDFFAGNASWADEYQAVLSLGEVVSDNMEICEQLYFGS